jgi:hypothetical protein
MQVELRVLATGALRIYDPDSGTAASSTAGDIVAGTTYFIWFHYVKGTGANAQYTVYKSTTSTRGSAVASSVIGEATGDIAQIYFLGTGSTTVSRDNVLVNNTEIGDGTLP